MERVDLDTTIGHLARASRRMMVALLGLVVVALVILGSVVAAHTSNERHERGLFARLSDAPGARALAAERERIGDSQDRLHLATQVSLVVLTLALCLVMRLWWTRTGRLHRHLHRTGRMLLDAPNDGIFAVDADGLVSYVNPAVTRILGYAPEDLLGRRCHAIFHHTRPDGSPYPIEDCPLYGTLASGIPSIVDDELFWHADGTPIPVEYSTNAVFENGRIAGAVAVFRDVSERRLAEQAKAEFTAIASHEIRTPLTSLLAALSVLERDATNLDERERLALDIASRNARRISRLVHDVLDMERYAAGVVPFDARPCDVRKLYGALLESVQGLASEAGVELRLDGHDVVVAGDEPELVRVLTNLVDNSIKHSAPGARVRVSCVERAGQALFTVEDEGPGIPPDRLDAVFDRFTQLDSSDARRYPGTGLGLTICRDIVKRHGGRIWAESDGLNGTSFRFTVPLAEVAGPMQQQDMREVV